MILDDLTPIASRVLQRARRLDNAGTDVDDAHAWGLPMLTVIAAAVELERHGLVECARAGDAGGVTAIRMTPHGRAVGRGCGRPQPATWRWQKRVARRLVAA